MKSKTSHFFSLEVENSPQRRILRYLHGLVFQRDFHLRMDDSSDVTCDPPQLWESLFSGKQQAGTGRLFLVIM